MSCRIPILGARGQSPRILVAGATDKVRFLSRANCRAARRPTALLSKCLAAAALVPSAVTAVPSVPVAPSVPHPPCQRLAVAAASAARSICRARRPPGSPLEKRDKAANGNRLERCCNTLESVAPNHPATPLAAEGPCLPADAAVRASPTAFHRNIRVRLYDRFALSS